MSATPFELRPICRQSAEDLAAVLDVYRRCEDFLALGPVAVASMDMVQADLVISVEEGGTFCGIHRSSDGRMVGIVDFVPCGFEGEPDLGFLSLLMIAAPYRSAGLGARVVALVEAKMRAAGAKRARSGVQVNNPRAVCFWQRMGYTIISGPELMLDGTTVYRLGKDLEGGRREPENE